MLFSNPKLNFNCDTLSSLLAMIHAGLKSYRSAVFAFRMSLFNSIPVFCEVISLCRYFLWIHSVVLESEAIQPSKAEDRQSLTFPMTDLSWYYDSRLLADASTVPEGLLLTLNILLACRRTVFTLFEMYEVILWPQNNIR